MHNLNEVNICGFGIMVSCRQSAVCCLSNGLPSHVLAVGLESERPLYVAATWNIRSTPSLETVNLISPQGKSIDYLPIRRFQSRRTEPKKPLQSKSSFGVRDLQTGCASKMQIDSETNNLS